MCLHEWKRGERDLSRFPSLLLSLAHMCARKGEGEISSPLLLLSLISSCARVCGREREELFSPYPLSLATETIYVAHLLHVVLFFLLSSHLSLFSLSCASLYCSPSHPPLRSGGRKNLIFFSPSFSRARSLSLLPPLCSSPRICRSSMR